MIDLLYAKENISKYKFDYLGYQVIVDSIRISEVIESNKLREMIDFYKYLLGKYKNEIKRIKPYLENKKAFTLQEKASKQTYINNLQYFKEILPSIGFILLGLEKQIGIEKSIPINLFI